MTLKQSTPNPVATSSKVVTQVKAKIITQFAKQKNTFSQEQFDKHWSEWLDQALDQYGQAVRSDICDHVKKESMYSDEFEYDIIRLDRVLELLDLTHSKGSTPLYQSNDTEKVVTVSPECECICHLALRGHSYTCIHCSKQEGDK